jgi:predicted aspartyl protease
MQRVLCALVAAVALSAMAPVVAALQHGPAPGAGLTAPAAGPANPGSPPANPVQPEATTAAAGLAPGAVDADAPLVTAVSQRDRRGRPLADVMVNGQGPFRFVVDTGANRSVISRALADRLALERIGSSQVNAVNGSAVRDIARTARIEAGALRLTNLETPVLDSDVLGQADGLLGTQGLSGKRLLFDNANQTLVISQGSPRGAPRGFSVAPLTLRFGRLAMAQAQIGKVRFKAVIDTGAEAAVANTALIRALTAADEAVDPQMEVTVTGATNVASPARWTILPRLRMGAIEVVMVETAVADLHVFDLWGLSQEPAMIVGMNILRQTEAFAIDYRARELQVKFLQWTTTPEFVRLRGQMSGSDRH